MQKIITFLFCVFVLSANAQERLNTFHIVDNDTKMAIPAVSISIVRAKLAVSTEKDGIFSIPGNLGIMRDTIIFYAQNYSILKIPLSRLAGKDTVNLKKSIIKTAPLQLNSKEDSLLNNFNRRDIVYYAGLHTETALFEYLQLAEQFDLPAAGAVLTSVEINRLAFVFPMENIQFTTYRIRIYDIDTLSGRPGADLCNEIIEVKNNDTRRSRINLKDYKIVVPNKTFFIAVEWLRDFRNMGYAMVYDEKTERDVKHINYRPVIGISPVKSAKLNIWGLDFKGEWKPYTYFSPDGTDLAIKASVQY